MLHTHANEIIGKPYIPISVLGVEDFKLYF